MSKGSSPRPYSVSLDEFASNWDAIFEKKDEQVTENKDQKEQEKENTNELG
jgi:hypothetical protein